jgi:hypothetical protein
MDALPATIGHNSAIAAYNEFRSQLDTLRRMNEEARFNYEDPKGNKEARSHIYKLRQTKAAVEKARKEEKAASLEYGRRVDQQAKEIMAEIDGMIEVHEAPIREIEQREKDRIAKHQADLSEMEEAGRHTAESWLEIPLQAMKDRLAEIESESIGEDRWEELALIAAQTKERAITSIRDAIAKRQKHDAEQAELERLRKEAEERERAEREEQIRKEATQRAAEEAERKAREERERVEAEAAKAKADAERRELELKLAAEQAERRAAQAAKDAEERLRREAEEMAARETEEAAAREANKKHRGAINKAAADAFVKGGLSERDAKAAVTLIAQKTIPRVSISY